MNKTLTTPSSMDGTSRRPVRTGGVVASAFLLSYVLLSLYGATYGIPVPATHDEFAYLLSADTFAHGRLTNPTPPESIHFETFHVLMEPTYQAKFPPGQGAALALGQRFLGHPAQGIWLSYAAAMGALCWMLLACCPPRFALLATILFATHIETFHYWGQTYWGGAVPMLGGCLLFGGTLRLAKGIETAALLAVGAGVILLLNSRPAESTLLSLPAALLFLACARRGAQNTRQLLRALIVPLLALLACFLWLMYYNHRLVGDPFELVYSRWSEMQSHHLDIRMYMGSFAPSTLDKSVRLYRFFFGYVLTAALLLACLPPWRWQHALAAFFVVFLAGTSILLSRGFPHYVSPVAAFCVLLVALGLQRLAAFSWRARPVGQALLRALVLLHLALGGYWWFQRVRHRNPDYWAHQRQALVAQLHAEDGKHLVLVRYGEGRDIHQEWIYNAADLGEARVVWARALDAPQHERLFEHFPDRRRWLLELPAAHPTLQPWPDGSAPPRGEGG